MRARLWTLVAITATVTLGLAEPAAATVAAAGSFSAGSASAAPGTATTAAAGTAASWQHAGLIYHSASRTQRQWQQHLMAVNAAGQFTGQWLSSWYMVSEVSTQLPSTRLPGGDGTRQARPARLTIKV